MEKKRKRGAFDQFCKIKKQKPNDPEKCKYMYCKVNEYISGYCKIHFLQALKSNLINLNKLKLSELVLIKKHDLSDQLKSEIDSIIMLKSFELLKIK